MVFKACSNGLKKASIIIDTGIGNFFRWEGKVVARHPYLTIFFTLALTIGLAGYGIFFKFYEEVNPAALYAAKDAPSVPDKDYVESLYGFLPMEEKLLVVSKDGLDANLLTDPRTSLSEMMAIWEEIESVESKGLTTFEELCDRPVEGHPCKVFSILQFWDFNRTKLMADADPLSTINSGPLIDGYGKEVEIEIVLGGIKRDQGGQIISANSFQNIFALDLILSDYERELFDMLRSRGEFKNEARSLAQIEDLLAKNFDPRVITFDRMVSDAMRNWSKKENAKMVAMMTHIFLVQEESDIAIRQDMIWILLTGFLVGVFSHIVLFRNNLALCKLHLVALCFFAIAMAVGASFGLSLIIGIPFNLIVTTVPFLLVGLGVDDTFIIMGQFKRTNRRLPPEERISLAMSRAGSSIFVTSLTDLAAFLLALSSSIPALQQFGIYASFGVLFDFLFQVTTFVAFAALEARREYRMLGGAGMLGLMPPKKLASESPGSNKSETIKSSGAPQESTMERMPAAGNQWVPTTYPEKSRTEPNGRAPFLPVEQRPIFGHQFNPDAPAFSTKLFGSWIPTMTMTRWGSIIVLLLEVVGIGVAIYGCINISVDFQFREWFAPKGWLHEGFHVELEYFQGEQLLLDVFTKEGNYVSNQKEMLECVEAIRESPFVADLPRAHSWFEEFTGWTKSAHSEEATVDGFATNAMQLVDWVIEFLGTDEGRYYHRDVLFNHNHTAIVGTKLMQAFSTDVVDGIFAVDLMNNIREVALLELPALDPIIFNPMFPFYDGLRIIGYETFRNVIVVGVAVFVVVSLTLANLWAAFLVVLMIGLTDIMILGYMWYAGLTFNMVTSISVVLAVGIAVDYAVHITHNFLVQKGTKPERATLALQNIGGEVFCAAFTSLLAVVGLGFAKHYVMQVFFKMFSMIIVFGAWHGMIILPLVLSIIGPPQTAEPQSL